MPYFPKTFDRYRIIDYLIGMLLDSGLDLKKRMLLKCSITVVFTCPLILWCKISSPFSENTNAVVFPFPFHFLSISFMPLANSWFICLLRQFPIISIRRFSDLYPLIHPRSRPLRLGRRRILIPVFIQSPPMLAVCDVAHPFPLRGLDMNFPFTEDQT